jgi:WD40 repeat protein
MGVVFRARQVSLNRVVAVKLILAGELASAASVERFYAEAELAAGLDHPNIVPIYEVGEHEGLHFFSMKLIEGRSLDVAAAKEPFSPRHAAQVMVLLASAVHYAHQRGVLHRDIKPKNILIDASGQPHLSDFGLAKSLEQEGGLTRTPDVLGTPSYMSPEQAAGKTKRLTTAADVYSLGAVFYELLTGQPPFAGATIMETVRQVLDKEPRRPSALKPGIDRDLETICLKCLEKDPARRYGSAEALAEDLERWLRREPIQARPIATLGRLGKWTQRNPRTAALLLLCGLAILAFLVGQTVMSVRLSRANTRVEAANVNLTRSLYEAQWRKADEAARAEEHGEAIARFSHFLRENPSDADASARLLSLLSSCNFPVLLLPPLLQETPVIAMDFSRAGDRLATATSGGMARLWNVESGKLEVELAHPAPLENCLLCGANDKRLLTLSSEPNLRLWDLGSRRLLSELELGPLNDARARRAVETTRDHRRVATNVRSNVLEILDTESGVWLQPGLVFPTEISRFAMSADGQLLAVSSTSELRLFKFGGEQPLFPPVELGSAPEDILFSDDGRWLACSCRNKGWLMNTSTGLREPEFFWPLPQGQRLSAANAIRIAFLGRTDRLITVPEVPDAPMSLLDPHTGRNCGSPFGQLDFDAQWHGALLFSFRDLSTFYPRTVRLLDPATGRAQTEPFIHDGPISAARLRADGRVVATASQDRTVRLWSADMRPAEPLTLALGGAAWEAQWSPSGKRVMYTYVAGNRAELRFSNGQTGAVDAPPAELDGTAWFAQWSPDGSRVAAMAETSATIWNAHNARPLSPHLQHDGKELVHCAFSPDGELLATSGADHTVRLWDGHTGKAVNLPLLHSDNPLKISFSSDGGRLATACLDGTIRVWSVPEGKLVLGPLRHSGICWVAAFSPDDRWIVTASSDSTAQLWDARTGQPVLPPFRHEGPVLWASFGPDGRAIATSTESGTARIWDTASGQLLTEPMNHPGKVWFVKWSPDGRFLATTCIEGSARVWDARTGHLVAQPFRHEGEVRRAEFSPNGQRLLTAGYDGAVKIWDLSFLRPPLPVPDWLPLLAESLGGKRLGSKDSLESVPGDSFQIAKASIEQWGKNDYYGRWAQWFLQERFERPVSPFQP